MKMNVWHESIPLKREFRIARGARLQADVLRLRLSDGLYSVVAESVPYKRYGETIDSAMAQLQECQDKIESGLVNRDNCHEFLNNGAARNALNSALWYLDCQKGLAKLPMLNSVFTAYTLSLDSVDAVGLEAKNNAHRPLLKIKCDGLNSGEDDMARLQAIRLYAPNCTIIIDANESWHQSTYLNVINLCQTLNIAMIEQPFKAGQDEILANCPRPIPIFADESLHICADFHKIGGLYDGINIKLDKTGGLSEAFALKKLAQEHNKQIMIGCMVGSSLSMLGAYILYDDSVKYIDIDGPLWLKYDSIVNFNYNETTSEVSPSKNLRIYGQSHENF